MRDGRTCRLDRILACWWILLRDLVKRFWYTFVILTNLEVVGARAGDSARGFPILGGARVHLGRWCRPILILILREEVHVAFFRLLGAALCPMLATKG